MNRIHIVGIGGAYGAFSTSQAAMSIALEAAAAEGADITVLDLKEWNLPMYVHGLDPVPEIVQAFCNTVKDADALVWSSPLYHGTVSGAFKNAIDWLELISDGPEPYLTNKAVGLISTAGGIQGLQAINTMEFMVRALRGWTVPLVVPVQRAWKIFDKETGELHDEKVEAQLKMLGREVVSAARKFKQVLPEAAL